VDDPDDLRLIAERIRVMLGLGEYQAALPLPSAEESIQSESVSAQSVDQG
jgi:hypothetical protein